MELIKTGFVKSFCIHRLCIILGITQEVVDNLNKSA